MNIKILVVLLIITGSFNSCSEPESWQDAVDNVPPKPVSNVKIENLNGGARITYSLPDDTDLLGVKAIYSLVGDQPKEVFSSAFRDTILLAGYVTTDEQLVKLITVDKSRNQSDPVEIQIKPLEAPISIIRNSLLANSTFGGVYTHWENPFEEEIAINLYTEDSTGGYVLYDTHYTKQAVGSFSFRGLTNVEQKIRLEFRDRWNNYSLPLDTILSPLFEERIAGQDERGAIWQRWGWEDQSVLYRGDIPSHHSDTRRQFPSIYDGVTSDLALFWNTMPSGNTLAQFIDWPDPEAWVMPMYFTVDMGREASYSRIRFWMRPRVPLFSAPIFTRFEVYGTSNPKPLQEIGDGSKEANLRYWTEWPEVGGTDEWKNDWVKLLEGEVELPSGETDPNLLTQQDHEFITNGFEFEVNPELAGQHFRYLRFVVKETNTKQAVFHLAELKVWGAYK